jgi:hypothetical protein
MFSIRISVRVSVRVRDMIPMIKKVSVRGRS